MKPIFRNSMFGFHREDVSSFIAKQSKQYEKRIAELMEEQKRIETELEKKSSAHEEYLAELEELRADFKRKAEAENKVREILEKLNEEKLSLSEGAEACGNHFDQMKEGIGELNQKLADALSFRDKAKKFDQLANVLSGILSGEVREAAEDHSAEEKMAEMNQIACNTNPIQAQKESIARLSELLAKLSEIYSESIK